MTHLFSSLPSLVLYTFPGEQNCEGWVWDRKTEEGKAEGCEVSFSFSGRRIFQLHQSVLIEEREQPGSPAENETSTVRWDGSFQNTLITHYSKLLPIMWGWGEEIINKRNQCAFSANHGAAVCEAAALDAHSLGWFVPYKWDPGNVCNYKVKLHTCKF